jgi:hypothetical protein
MRGTSVHVFGDDPNTLEAERALRSLALEPRLQRRLLGAGLIGARDEAEKQAKDRFVRVAVPGPHSRRVRANMLHAYCLCALSEHRHLGRAVGIAFDASRAFRRDAVTGLMTSGRAALLVSQRRPDQVE